MIPSHAFVAAIGLLLGGFTGTAQRRGSAPIAEMHDLYNGAPVRIIQFGKGEVQPYFVTLRPAETLVSSLPGIGALAFYYGLGDLVPAWTDVSWINVVSVQRSADRREILFRFEGNSEPSPRMGTIDIGGKTFAVLQQAGQVQ